MVKLAVAIISAQIRAIIVKLHFAVDFVTHGNKKLQVLLPIELLCISYCGVFMRTFAALKTSMALLNKCTLIKIKFF